MGRRLACAVGMLAVLLWTCERVRAEASWVGQPYVLSIPTHITTCGQTVTGSIDLTINHDAFCWVHVDAAGAGQEVLKNGAASLVTSYKITGPSLWNGDADWVGSTDFLSHSYLVLGSNPADVVTLSVRAVAPAGAAPEAGVYSAAIVLTASW